MNTNRVDKIIQFALLVAGEADEYRDRELGPIHIVKYVYLADLDHARAMRGHIYTQAAWRFHKFGPWDADVFMRITPALEAVDAKKKVISHPQYEDDFARWSLKDDELLRELENTLPLSISFGVKAAIRAFGADTASLLDYVYRTSPMLKAAPGEHLLFHDIGEGEAKTPINDRQDDIYSPQRNVEIKKLRTDMQKMIANIKQSSEATEPDPPPRYDGVYEKGMAWLDDLAGTRIEDGDYVAEISDDCWKSRARYDPELP
ncbi:MAG TPA: hypothetical protein ENN79_08250 [Desulfobacteraceae bacterium]|nr:hypothetical protein [Desulfobacteraceae bacterium]